MAFCGHPIKESQEECEDLGKRLKRNNVALDIINFSNPDNVPKLEAIINTCNNSNNSHFQDVPMGAAMLTDILFSSPIMGNDDNPGVPGSQQSAANPGQPAADRFAEYGGINPDIEPDLAMAMKLSMQEDENRRKAAEQEA